MLRDRTLEPLFLLYPKLGREEDSATSGPSVPTSRLRLEAVERVFSGKWLAVESSSRRSVISSYDSEYLLRRHEQAVSSFLAS